MDLTGIGLRTVEDPQGARREVEPEIAALVSEAVIRHHLPRGDHDVGVAHGKRVEDARRGTGALEERQENVLGAHELLADGEGNPPRTREDLLGIVRQVTEIF